MIEKTDKKERQKLLRELTKTTYGAALKSYLIEKLIELNDLTSINDYENFQAKKESKKMLLDIFKFLTVSERQIKEQTTNQYQ